VSQRNFRSDDSGRVPFALIAILIIIFASFSTIYITTINNRYYLGSGNVVDEMKDLLEAESERIQYLAGQAIRNALGKDDTHTSLVWSISQDAYRNFTELVAPYFPPNGIKTAGGYELLLFEPVMTVSPLPFEYENFNPLGMKARMRSHVYLKAIGSAELIMKDPISGARVNTTVSLDTVVPSTRTFLMEQMVKFQIELKGDSSVGSDIAKIVEYMIEQEIRRDDTKVISDNLSRVVNIAILLEEIKLFHDYDEVAAAALGTNNYGMNFNDYVSTQTLVDPSEIYLGIRNYDDPLLIDVSTYGQPFFFDGGRCRMNDTSRDIEVSHNGELFEIIWDPGTSATWFEKRSYNFNGSVNKLKNVYVHHFKIDSPPVHITLSGGDEISSDSTSIFESDVELDLDIKFFDGSNENGFTDEPVRVLDTEYESAIEEYANHQRAKGEAKLEIFSRSNVPLKNTGALADIHLDGDFLGTFRESPILPNIYEGIHELAVELVYPDGLKEFETLFFNITSEGYLENGLNNVLDFNMSFEGPDSTEFWISSILGYPFPQGIDNISKYYERTAFEDYLSRFSGYVESLSGIWDPSFSNFVDVAETTLEFAYDTLDMVEGILSEGLDIGQIALNVGINAIELRIDDPTLKTIGKIIIGLIGPKVQNITFTIKDEVLKTKILKNLKHMGDALALIGLTISVFKMATEVVEIFSGDKEKKLEEVLDIAFGFAEIALKIWSTAISIVKNIVNIAEDIVAKLTLRLQKISAAVLIVYIFVSELAKNNWDFVKTLESLFLGFDELTITWYSTIITSIAMTLGKVLVTAAASYVGIIVAGIAFLIMIILSWDEISAWITNSLSNNSVTALEKSIGGSLQDTLNLTGKLNDMNPQSYAAQARNYYSLSGDMLRRSYFVQSEVEARMLQNLSDYSFDFYKAYRDASHFAVQTGSAVKLFWFTANDFDNQNYPHGRNNADANITVDYIGMINWDFADYLSEVTASEAEIAVVEYNITDYPHNDAFDAWKGNLDNVSRFLSASIDGFQDAMSRIKYLNVFPDSCKYERGYGALTIEAEGQSGLQTFRIRVTSAAGKFRYAYNGEWISGNSFESDVTADAHGNIQSTVFLVEPGTYTVKVLQSNVPLRNDSGTFTVTSGSAESFLVRPQKKFQYTLNSTSHGYVVVRTYENSEGPETHVFSSPGKKSITVPPNVFHYRAEVLWDTDGNVTNGTEENLDIYWNLGNLGMYQVLYHLGISIEVKIEEPRIVVVNTE
jgi:hypothetical protein